MIDMKNIAGKKVLITGGLGFIGSNLAKKCLELGANVTIFDNLMEDTGANMFNIKEIKEDIEIIIGDIRNEEDVKKAVSGKDLIFNLAAQVSHILSMENPELDIDINCKGQINLLEACRKFNPDVKIVYTGTRTQFGKVEKQLIGELEQDNPLDIYGVGKLAGEIYHMIYNKSYGLKATSLRLTNVYGPKAQIKNPKYGVINWFIGKSVLGGDLTIYEPGTQLRDYIYVADVVDALIVSGLDDRANGEVFVLGSGVGMSMLDSVRKIVVSCGSGSVKMIHWPKERKNIEVGDAVLDISKIKNVLGWTPKYDFESGIEKTIDFYKKNIDEYLEGNEKMNILVTGGLGHIGSKLIREYAKRADIGKIRILDNFLVQRYCSLFNLPENKKYEFIEGDITNLEDVEKAMNGIDIVIHLAAITDAPATLKNKEETFNVNLEGTRNVLNSAIKNKIKKFLFPSTTSVYGEAEGFVDESYPNDLYKPSSPYAEAKRTAEKMVLEAYKETGLNTNVLRLGTIFGESIGMRFHTAVNKFCYLASMDRPLTVWDSALGNKRPYLGLSDCISAFQFIEKNGAPGELYNVLTKNYTIQNMVDEIRKVVPSLNVEITKSPILNQKSYNVSDKKVRDLGFVPVDDIGNDIKATVELFKAIDNSGEQF